MQETMRALRIYGPHDIRVERVPVPQIGEDEMLIKVGGCGICGSDLKNYAGGHEWNVPPEERFIQTPAIAGHEFYGEVVAVGSKVQDYQIGDMMISEQIVPCGKCRFCRDGHYWMCQNLDMYGFRDETPGGFAEYMRIHKRGINHKIPREFTLEQAVLIEPFACSMHAVERAKIEHNDVVVISGLGAIGLAMVSIARLKIPKLLIGLDLRENRRSLAKEFGADLVLNPAECDVVKEIKALTDGYGCDVYIEAAGSGQSVQQGLKSVRNLGRYIQFGIVGKEILVNWDTIGDEKELDIYGSHLGPYCYDAVITGIAQGMIPTKGIVTHIFPFEEWERAYQLAQNDKTAIKVVLVP